MNVIEKNYTLIKSLGSGDYSTVYKARRKKDDKIIALKLINVVSNMGSEKELHELVDHEIKILKTLSQPACNPFVVCYYNSYYDQNENIYLIETEYIEGNNMSDMNRFSMLGSEKNEKYNNLLIIARDIADALDFVHSKNIIHNDVIPSNIVIIEKYDISNANNIQKTFKAKLVDFGIACFANIDGCKIPGRRTLEFTAPEIIDNDKSVPASDMWALGLTLYIKATGKNPYSNPFLDAENLIMDEDPPVLNTDNKLLNNIVNKLLVKDPNKRLTAKQLRSMLSNISDVIPSSRVIILNDKMKDILSKINFGPADPNDVKQGPLSKYISAVDGITTYAINETSLYY